MIVERKKVQQGKSNVISRGHKWLKHDSISNCQNVYIFREHIYVWKIQM